MRPAGTSEITAVLHAGALGPLDERCLRRVERCDWGALLYNECSVDSMVKVRKVCPGPPCSVLPVIKRPGTHVCQPILVGGLQKPSAFEGVPGVDAFPSVGQPMGFSVLQDPSGRQAGWGVHRSPGSCLTDCVYYSLTHFWLFSKTWVQLLFVLSAGIVPA